MARGVVREQRARRGDHDRQDEGQRQAAEGQHQVRGAPRLARCERLYQYPGHRDAEHDQHRRKLAVLDARRGYPARRGGNKSEAHGVTPFWATAGCCGTGSVTWIWLRVWCTAGLMMSSTGLG